MKWQVHGKLTDGAKMIVQIYINFFFFEGTHGTMIQEAKHFQKKIYFMHKTNKHNNNKVKGQS